MIEFKEITFQTKNTITYTLAPDCHMCKVDDFFDALQDKLQLSFIGVVWSAGYTDGKVEVTGCFHIDGFTTKQSLEWHQIFNGPYNLGVFIIRFAYDNKVIKVASVFNDGVNVNLNDEVIEELKSVLITEAVHKLSYQVGCTKPDYENTIYPNASCDLLEVAALSYHTKYKGTIRLNMSMPLCTVDYGDLSVVSFYNGRLTSATACGIYKVILDNNGKQYEGHMVITEMKYAFLFIKEYIAPFGYSVKADTMFNAVFFAHSIRNEDLVGDLQEVPMHRQSMHHLI